MVKMRLAQGDVTSNTANNEGQKPLFHGRLKGGMSVL